MYPPGLRSERDLVDPVADLVHVEGATDRLVVEDDIYGHLAPARLGRVHSEGERVPGLGPSSVVLVRNLKKVIVLPQKRSNVCLRLLFLWF